MILLNWRSGVSIRDFNLLRFSNHVLSDWCLDYRVVPAPCWFTGGCLLTYYKDGTQGVFDMGQFGNHLFSGSQRGLKSASVDMADDFWTFERGLRWNCEIIHFIVFSRCAIIPSARTFIMSELE
jgi:hypothetical protein